MQGTNNQAKAVVGEGIKPKQQPKLEDLKRKFCARTQHPTNQK